MNRLVIIGNGFDLEHGLQTRYQDFFEDYWVAVLVSVVSTKEYKDDFIEVKIDHSISHLQIQNTEQLKKYIDERTNPKNYFEFKNKLWKKLYSHYLFEKWVDMENFYYDELVSLIDKENSKDLEKLNQEWGEITEELKKYLTKIEKLNSILETKERIKEEIYTEYCYKDIVDAELNLLFEEEYKQYKSIYLKWIGAVNNRRLPYIPCFKYDASKTDERFQILDKSTSNEFIKTAFKKIIIYDKEFMIKRQLLNLFKSNQVSNYFDLSIKNILLLNFNYTQTASKYLKEPKAKTINIHGSLKDPENPIIFGYGDELDENYKKLENTNNNKYLENVKSIKYLRTNNYKELLRFINSDKFQIFIFGHSCGNSDRTLLNTIFEHENCVSVKPYYFKDEEGKDNYNDIVMNISRCFENKAVMRDKVVNKEYTKALFGSSVSD